MISRQEINWSSTKQTWKIFLVFFFFFSVRIPMWYLRVCCALFTAFRRWIDPRPVCSPVSAPRAAPVGCYADPELKSRRSSLSPLGPVRWVRFLLAIGSGGVVRPQVGYLFSGTSLVWLPVWFVCSTRGVLVGCLSERINDFCPDCQLAAPGN